MYMYIYIWDIWDGASYMYTHTHINIQGAHNKFPDFFRMDTFIDSKHMKL